MEVLSALVKYAAGRVFASKRGDRQSIKLELESGAEIDIWFDAGDPHYCSLTRGEVVQVIQHGEKYTVAFPEEAEEPVTPQATPAALSGETAEPVCHEIEGVFSFSDRKRAEIFIELCKRALILKSCHTQINQAFTHPDTGKRLISEEAVQQYAITLYSDLKHYWQ